MADATFDAYAGAYDAALNQGLALSGESKDYFARRRIDWLASRVAERSGRPERILDFGCGTGGSATLLLERLNAGSVTGVDTSAESIAVARRERNPRIRFQTVDERQPVAEYDLVYSNGVFHHIEPADRPHALEYIRRSLEPRGWFAFWENNPWNPGTRLVMRRIPFDRDAQLVSAPEARRLLEAAGFDIVCTDFLFLFPRAIAVLRPLESRLTRLPAGAQYLVLCRTRA